VAAEAALRVSGASADSAARDVLESKQCYAHTMEFQGLLVADSFPFACGFGVPSKAGFGQYMPKGFVVKSWVIQSNSTDTAGAAELNLVHYPYNSLTGTVVSTMNLDSTYTSNTQATASASLAAGSIVVQIGAAGTIANLVDVDARYRVTLYCQMTEAL